MSVEIPLTEPIKDNATVQGTFKIRGITLGAYLALLGLYDERTRTANLDTSIINAAFQRAILPIQKNPIKLRMLRDLMRGGTLPPIVLSARNEERPHIVDGLQRTDVLTEALKALLALQKGEEPKDYAKKELETMRKLDQLPLPVNEFLNRPVVLQIWHNLSADELVRLFMVLNAGQQKVSPRHLLEVMGDELREMFGVNPIGWTVTGLELEYPWGG